MKILYIGGGFVGACSAAVSADSGHDVLVYDIDKTKVEKLSTDDRDVVQSCLHEDGLADLLIRNRSRIVFTLDKRKLGSFAEKAEAVFMCLPTPEKEGAEGESDLSYYEAAVEMIGAYLARRDGGKQTSRIVVINKSTVPIRMIDYTEELFTKQGVKNFGIVSNPEFLVEGKAIEGSIRPDRVVVGCKSGDDFKVMRQVYQRFVDSSSVKYIEVNPYEAAAGKLLANFLLFNKVVTTFDVVGRTCEQFDHIQYEQVRKVLIVDPRIGSWGLYDSLFSGGSCFIKDAGSLAHQLENAGARASLVRGILDANIFQLDHFFGRAETEAHFDWVDKTVAVLGLAFKQDTNDLRNSGAISVIQQLIGVGVKKIKVYDPAAMNECKNHFGKNPHVDKISYELDEKGALKDTSAAIICTDWPQFKILGDLIQSVCPAPYLVMDGRRIIHGSYESLAENGYDIIAVGSPFIKGKK
ncbi:MAG: nucleotide sugar dehydrogenase [Patescibacteria group bacterium]